MFVTVTGFFLTPFFPLLNIFSPKSMYMMIWRVRNITLSAAQHREDFYHSFLEPAGLVILSSRNYLCTTSSMSVCIRTPHSRLSCCLNRFFIRFLKIKDVTVLPTGLAYLKETDFKTGHILEKVLDLTFSS